MFICGRCCIPSTVHKFVLMLFYDVDEIPDVAVEYGSDTLRNTSALQLRQWTPEMQLQHAASVPVPWDSDDDDDDGCRSQAVKDTSDDDDDDGCRSQAVSDTTTFTALSYASETYQQPYGCFDMSPIPEECYYWYQVQWSQPLIDEPDSLSSLTMQINQRLLEFKNVMEPVTDQRSKREGQFMGLWRLGPGAASEVVFLPTDLYVLILNTACALAQDESKNANGKKTSAFSWC